MTGDKGKLKAAPGTGQVDGGRESASRLSIQSNCVPFEIELKCAVRVG